MADPNLPSRFQRFISSFHVPGEAFLLNIAYLVFLVSFFILFYIHKSNVGIRTKDGVFLLAGLFAISGGFALLVTILSDYTGRAAMFVVPRILRQARLEGRKEADEETNRWYRRMLEAKERGEAFDEPPPSMQRRE